MPLRRTPLLLLSLLSTLFFSLPVLAQSPERPLAESYQGLRSSGVGNSHVAVASGTDAIYQNPAGIARAPMYVVDGAFSYTPQGALMSVGIADSKINPQIAGGATYNYFYGHSEHSHLSGHDVRVVAAIPAVPERVSIGIGGRYLRITDTTLPEIDDNPSAQVLLQGFTFDAGIAVRAADMLHLGLVGQNLIDHCRDNSLCRGTTPTRLTAGLGLGDETLFMISGQASLDLTSSDTPLFDFAAGAEVLAAGIIPIRAGFERRAFLDRNLLTFGLGWRSEQAGVDFSYRHDLNDLDRFGYISGGFSVYF